MIPELSLQNWLVILGLLLTNIAIGLFWIGWPNFIKRFRDWLTADFTRSAIFLTVVCLGIWIGIFLIYRFPVTGDVEMFYQPQARAVRSGAIPNVDFQSSYMPLFPYVLGIVDWIWPNLLAIPFFFTVVNILAALVVRQMMVQGGIDGSTASALMLVGTLNGASWFLGIGCQQDETLLVFFAALGGLLLLRKKEFLAGALLALGLLITKILFGIFVLAVASQSKNIKRVILGFVLILVPIISLFLILGFNPLRMIRGESGALIPPSISFLIIGIPLHSIAGPAARITHALAALILLIVILRFANFNKVTQVIPMNQAILAGWSCFLLLSPKSFTFYRLVILPFLPLLLDKVVRHRVVCITIFCAYSTVLGLHWMLHEDWIGGRHRSYYSYFTEHIHNPQLFIPFLIVLSLDLMIVAAELFWFRICWKRGSL